MSRTPKRDAPYLLKLTKTEREDFGARARAIGEPLSEVMRQGTEMYLSARENGKEVVGTTLEQRVAQLERAINERHFR